MRYTFGGDHASWVMVTGDQVVDDNDVVAGYVAEMWVNVTVTLWDAPSGGAQITDLVDLDGAPIGTSVTSDATGHIPAFRGPDGVRLMWASASEDGSATRYAMPAVDLGVEVAGIETRLAVLEAGGVGSAVPETIRFTAAQITEDIAASPPTPYRAYNNTGASQTITGVRLSVGVAPADGPVTVDVRVDGVSVFANPGDQPSVGVGVNTSGLVSPTGTATVPAGSYVTVVPTAGDDTAEAVTVEVRVV